MTTMSDTTKSINKIKIPQTTPLAERNLIYKPFLFFLYKEVRRFWRVKGQTVMNPLIQSSLYLLIFGVSLGGSITLESGLSYMEFLIPGLVMMAALNNAFLNCASSIVTSKFHGDIQDLKIIPLSDYLILMAFALGGLIRGVVVGLLTLIACEACFFFIHGRLLPIAHPLIFLVFLIFGGLSFGFLGAFTGFWAKAFDHVNAIGGFIVLPLLYLGGVFYSIATLHPFLQTLSRLNPMLYFINGIRYGFLEQSDVGWIQCLWIAIVSMIICMFLSVTCFRSSSFQRW